MVRLWSQAANFVFQPPYNQSAEILIRRFTGGPHNQYQIFAGGIGEITLEVRAERVLQPVSLLRFSDDTADGIFGARFVEIEPDCLQPGFL